ncbi:MAG: glycine--tRNA ligase subunit beta [Elusimicrobia bacterium]|nr:glycine--tRNA ligase subunit beta [Elusimicrobiota bacterium]
MNKIVFLVEFGCEDLPPLDAVYIADSGPELLKNILKDFRLEYSGVRVFVTPRRIALQAEASAKQLSDEEKIKGPPVRVAMKDGEPTPAGLGFARKFNVDFSQLGQESTPKGDYLYYQLLKPGAPLEDIIADISLDFLKKLSFPVTMNWPESDFSFPRPIRWVTALVGDKLVDFTTCGLKSSTKTKGHYVFSKGDISLSDAASYEKILLENSVLVDSEKRKKLLINSIENLASEKNLSALMNEDLLDEINNSLEYPGCLLGSFPDKYLAMPREIIEACLIFHQRYIPINDSSGSLAPFFIGVRDGLPENLNEIKKGFESVLLARLKDAEFFFRKDRENSLEYYVEKLKGIEFTRGLGTLYEKTLRVKSLIPQLNFIFSDNSESLSVAEKIVELAKADLTTLTVGEFPELEGVIGSTYARLDQEAEAVSDGILQQYYPRTSEDSIPVLLEAAVAGFLDRLDTLTGNIGTEVKVTSSQDPYGMRRICRGMLRIAQKKGWDIDFEKLVQASVDAYPEDKLSSDAGEKTLTFILQQVRQYLEENFAYDVARSAAASGMDNPSELFNRARAIEQIKMSPGFVSLIAALKRAGNIIRQAEEKGIDIPQECDKALLAEESEKNLFEEYGKIKERVTSNFKEKNYFEGLRLVGSLREAVDAFFEDILVMDPDPKIMKNRLALLKGISLLGQPAGDLSLLED